MPIREVCSSENAEIRISASLYLNTIKFVKTFYRAFNRTAGHLKKKKINSLIDYVLQVFTALVHVDGLKINAW